MGAQNNHLNVTVLLSTLNVIFYLLNKETECKLIAPSYLEAWCLSIFCTAFVIDHINCYFFHLMTYSIGKKVSL